MNVRLLSALFFSIFIPVSLQAANTHDYLSFSVGQFDINDNKDSSEYRIEYLSEDVSLLSPGNFSLKPFYGAMLNGDSGKYFYSGLRKDIKLTHSTFFTPSFAVGYYDKGNSKDLGYSLEFRSQFELSYQLESLNRIAISVNHISNASFGNRNPGVESMVLSYIKVF